MFIALSEEQKLFIFLVLPAASPLPSCSLCFSYSQSKAEMYPVLPNKGYKVFYGTPNTNGI